MAFQKAEKRKAKLRLALTGVSGGGKTFSALVMASAFGKKVAVIDSERSSALLYADRFTFDHQDLTDHSIDRYRTAIREAAQAGYDVLVVDSLSHEWAGRGGVLEEVDRAAASARSKFGAWNGPSQKHNSLIDDLLLYPGHVIVTMRSKTEYVLDEVVRDGRKTQAPRKVGLAPVQRDGVEYEFTVLLDMDRSGAVHVQKSRCPLIEERASTLRREDLADVARTLSEWLELGTVPAPVAPPTPAPVAPTPVAPPTLAPPASPPQQLTKQKEDYQKQQIAEFDATLEQVRRERAEPPSMAECLMELYFAKKVADVAEIGTRLFKSGWLRKTVPADFGLEDWRGQSVRDVFTRAMERAAEIEKRSHAEVGQSA